MDVPVPDHVQGRVLQEIFSESSEISFPEMNIVTHERKGSGNYLARLKVTEVAKHFYLEEGWVDESLK